MQEKLFRYRDTHVKNNPHLTLWIKERPAALFKEALRIVHDGLHNLGPVQRLDSLCVLYVTRAVNDKVYKKAFILIKVLSWFLVLKFLVNRQDHN